jgi:hypothetical protein
MNGALMTPLRYELPQLIESHGLNAFIAATDNGGGWCGQGRSMSGTWQSRTIIFAKNYSPWIYTELNSLGGRMQEGRISDL